MMLRFLPLLLLLSPLSALAHAFGQQYTLPLPTSFYMAGGSLALLLSFVLLLLSPPREGEREGRVMLGRRGTERLVAVLRWGALLLLSISVAAGIAGPAAPTLNLAPLLLWVFFLLGFAYLSVFITGLWERIDPFAAIISRISSSGNAALPRHAGFIPLALYTLLIWAELLTGGAGATPLYIALGIFGYLVFGNIMASHFGIAAWRERFDVFGAFFRIIGTFAPLVVGERGVEARNPFSRSPAPAESAGTVLLILAALAFTAFDGFRETAPYADALISLSAYVPFALVDLIAFLLFPVLFFVLYVLCLFLTRILSGGGETLSHLVRAYAYSLVPIAVVYHFAHYFPLLVAEGQRIVSLASDPLGLGWDLFSTAAWRPDPGLIGADTVWYIQLTSIVLGHIIALYVSHQITRRMFAGARAVMAELPLLVVMVFYTAFGLWILSQPFAL